MQERSFISYQNLVVPALKKKQWQQALEHCNELMQAHPKHIQGYVWKGNALIELGEYDQAEAVFNQLRKEHPNNAQGLRGLALVAVRSHQWQLVLERCDDMTQAHPKHIQGYVWKGDALIELGEYDQAKTVFENLVTKFPDKPQSLLRLIRIEIMNQSWERALRISDILILKHSQHIQGHLFRAISLIGLNQHEVAQLALLEHLSSGRLTTQADKIKVLNILLDITEVCSCWDQLRLEIESLIVAHSCSFSLKNIDSSAPEFQLTEKYARKLSDNYRLNELQRFVSFLKNREETFSLASLLESRIAIQTGDERLAESILIKFGEMHSTWQDYTWLKLAIDAWERVDLNKCIDFCNLVSTDHIPRYSQSVSLKVKALIRQGKTEDAKAHLHELIDIDPKQVHSYLSLIEILFLHDKEYALALQTCNRAINCGASHEKILSYKCRLLSHMGEGKYAQALIEKAIYHRPYNPRISMTCLQVRRNNHQYSHALSLINEWLQRGKLSPIRSSSPSKNLSVEYLGCEPAYSVWKPDMVSVIMTVYKSHPYLTHAISSILHQTYENIELIIVDDASPDDTFEYLKKLSLLDARIRLFQLKSNSGTYVAKNEGMKHAKGTYVSFMDSDDWLHPQAIERQVQTLQSSQVVGVKCGFLRIYKGEQIEFEPEGPGITAHITTCFKKKLVVDTVGFFDAVRTAGDVEYQKRVELHFGKGAIQEIHFPLLFSTRHESSITGGGDLKTPWYGAPREVLDYVYAFKKWHRSIVYKEMKLFLPHPLLERPFKIPTSFEV